MNGKRAERWLDVMMTLPFNIASRCPVLNVPSGLSRDGVPTGLAVVGKTYDDVTAFRVAAAHEARLPWLTAPGRGPRYDAGIPPRPDAGAPPFPDSLATLANWQEPPFNRWAFQHVRELIPSARIARGDRPRAAAAQGMNARSRALRSPGTEQS